MIDEEESLIINRKAENLQNQKTLPLSGLDITSNLFFFSSNKERIDSF